jgi:hypothetical protein
MFNAIKNEEGEHLQVHDVRRGFIHVRCEFHAGEGFWQGLCQPRQHGHKGRNAAELRAGTERFIRIVLQAMVARSVAGSGPGQA